MKLSFTLRLSVIMLTTAIGLGTAQPSAWALNDNEVLSQHIKEADGTTGQDTNTGSGIKTGHIQNGAVSSSKIAAGAIGTGKIANSAVTNAKIADRTITPGKIGYYSRVVIVDVNGGGDFTSPVDAMNAITDASATTPCLLKIMPGHYLIGEGTVQMKPYVDIEGSGEMVTKLIGTVSSSSFPPLTGVVNGKSAAEIRFLRVENKGTGAFSAAVLNNGVSPKMTNMTAAAVGGTHAYGVSNINSSAPLMTNVTASATGAGSSNRGILNNYSAPVMNTVTASASGGALSYGIHNIGSTSSSAMTNVTASATGGSDSNFGVYNMTFAAPVMSDMKASASGGTTSCGVYNESSSPTMTNVTASGADGTNNYGMFNIAVANSYIIIADRSTFEGSTNSIQSDF